MVRGRRAKGVEKWQGKLCRMANQYCIYAQRGDSIAHLPEQQGFHRYIPADFWGKIMNISLFRATKTERSILMVENSVSWKMLLNNYHLSTVLSETPPASKYLLTKTHLVHPLYLVKHGFSFHHPPTWVSWHQVLNVKRIHVQEKKKKNHVYTISTYF